MLPISSFMRGSGRGERVVDCGESTVAAAMAIHDAECASRQCGPGIRFGLERPLTGAAKLRAPPSGGGQTPLLGKRRLPSSAKLHSSGRCAIPSSRSACSLARFDTPFPPPRADLLAKPVFLPAVESGAKSRKSAEKDGRPDAPSRRTVPTQSPVDALACGVRSPGRAEVR